MPWHATASQCRGLVACVTLSVYVLGSESRFSRASQPSLSLPQECGGFVIGHGDRFQRCQTLRGGGGGAEGLDAVGDWIGKTAGAAWKALDKDSADGMKGYYEDGDKMLQDLAKDASKLGDNIRDTTTQWSKDFQKTWPKTEKAVRDAVTDTNIDSVAHGVRMAVPGLDPLCSGLESRWLKFRFYHPVQSERVASAASAIAAFVLVAQLGQRAGMGLGISHWTAGGQPASLLGLGCVAAAGAAAGEAAHRVTLKIRPNTPRSARRYLPAISPKRDPIDYVLDAAAAVVFYKFLFRASFRHIAPSDLTKPGVFAREWVETTGENYANYGQRVRTAKVGWRRGCHHCGARFPRGMKLFRKWIADHQPPNKLVSMGEEQRFYPHCFGCSQAQSLTLRGFRSPLKLHLPSGPVIAGPTFLAVHPIIHWFSTAFKGAREAVPASSGRWGGGGGGGGWGSGGSVGGGGGGEWMNPAPRSRARKQGEFDWRTADSVEGGDTW